VRLVRFRQFSGTFGEMIELHRSRVNPQRPECAIDAHTYEMVARRDLSHSMDAPASVWASCITCCRTAAIRLSWALFDSPE
jgi:hypothetical protein